MIYDEIEKAVSNFLMVDFDLSEDEILTKSEVPPDDLDFFIRQVWTYGTLSEMTNQGLNEQAILNLEAYERKNSEINKLEDLIRDFRFFAYSRISLFNGENARAKLNGVYIYQNNNDEAWISYTIGLRFLIYKETNING